jgi:uncharacterized RDD family membrane protein YckC
MKCEKCAGVLPDKKVICPQCGFNNWHLRRNATSPARAAQTKDKPETVVKPSAALAAKFRARYTPENNLLHFPVAAKPAEEAAAEEPPSEPAWRAQTKAKVREHIERRKAEAEGGAPGAASDDPTRQLLVESALKRLRKGAAPPPVISTPIRSGGKAQALARALDYDEELLEAEPVIQPLKELPVAPLPQPSVNLPFIEPEVIQPETTVCIASPEIEEEIAVAESMLAEAELFDNTAELVESPIERRVNETPKAKAWVGTPAPLWLRTLAGSVDLEVAALAYLPFFAAYTSFDGPPEGADLYLMVAMLAAVLYLYQLITYSLNGRTFGMAICGLRCVVMEEASQPVSFKRRLWQALGGTVALLCPPLNFFATRVTEHQRGLADALAGTITLRRAQD